MAFRVSIRNEHLENNYRHQDDHGDGGRKGLEKEIAS